MRRESLYLSDIVEAADHIAEFITGIDFDSFQKSELLRSAVAQKLGVIGCPILREQIAGILTEEP